MVIRMGLKTTYYIFKWAHFTHLLTFKGACFSFYILALQSKYCFSFVSSFSIRVQPGVK